MYKDDMSSTPTMSIQHCPDEVLDMIFQLLPFQSPDKAPATLLHTLLTCRRFCAIAKRHFIRVVCLESAERVNLFAAYLTKLTNAGAYGSALLPIEHMAAFGNYRPRNIAKVKLRGQHNSSFHLSFRSQPRASTLSLYSGLIPGKRGGPMAGMSTTSWNPQFASQSSNGSNGLSSSISISSVYPPNIYQMLVIAFPDSHHFIPIDGGFIAMFSRCTPSANFVSICLDVPCFHPHQIAVSKPSS